MLASPNVNTPNILTAHVRAAMLSVIVALSSCSPASNSMLQTLRQAAWRGDSIAGSTLNPNFRYLRVTVNVSYVFTFIDIGT